ncbi:MAG TPA: phosphoglycerate kinase [Actinomycetota bacterium]|nr:phosphoglycerate kinase [Actinomycetota bacterium]
MTLRTLDDLVDIGGRRVFVRVDHNVPLKDGNVTDDARVRASLPTLTELLDAGTSLVVASHLGRPKGETRDELRMAPVADRLSELLERDVQALDEVVGDRVQAVCGHIEPGDVVYLENLRFDPREETNDTGFAGELADLADVYVDDAFGAVHRAHASVAALAELFVKEGRPAVAGRLLQEEVEALSRLLNDPDRPYVAVLGGAKVSDKLATIVALVERVDAILIGGAMAFTFLAADGGAIGDSLVEPDSFGEVREARTRAAERGVLIQLPEDVVAASEVTAEASRSTVPASAIPRGMKGLDIGPRTVEEFARSIADAKTILWNGPMGVFELEPFGAGTRGVATAVAGANAYTVAGGGDSLAAVAKYGLQNGFDHLSTGGGASLEFLEGRSLPGIAVLETDR